MEPFDLLGRLWGDDAMAAVWSERATIEAWLRVEAELARAQAATGVLAEADAEMVARAASVDGLDTEALWDGARNVGYPILPLVRAVAARLPDGPDGRVHYGATTQDIMDTGLALQGVRALDRLGELVRTLGDALERLMDAHRRTVMAGRTHGQQAVPTTFGATLAPLLDELARHAGRLRQVRAEIGTVSLFGAGGTSAAAGPTAAPVRRELARRLGLAGGDVPWHAARDSVAGFGALCASVAATCARLARNVIDLGRTEIGELAEADGEHRGASSTMPQKANPILAEAIVGMSASAGASVSALYRAMEVPQERAAGEWQIEWQVLPRLAWSAASCLAAAVELVAGLRVDEDAMRANLDADGGLVMSEAYMFGLAPELGRELAHDLVYAAARQVRRDGVELPEALRRQLTERGLDPAFAREPLSPADYVGDAELICASARDRWHAQRRLIEEERT
ncbi:class-II fumarase/aspartase family protein [Pseudonocardia acaciae]|uniref:class-II fumarase/aspartase family protein n=1 Tax=Pseudonocardia acaciae TaxID=551276 RepID=UPI0005687507|nr:adenylosuccinate lyase family protein [Pseudonocardia acaciae]